MKDSSPAKVTAATSVTADNRNQGAVNSALPLAEQLTVKQMVLINKKGGELLSRQVTGKLAKDLSRREAAAFIEYLDGKGYHPYQGPRYVAMVSPDLLTPGELAERRTSKDCGRYLPEDRCHTCVRCRTEDGNF